jgi:hypothetical protein
MQDTTSIRTLFELGVELGGGTPELRDTLRCYSQLDRSLSGYLVNTYYELLPNLVIAKNVISVLLFTSHKCSMQ